MVKMIVEFKNGIAARDLPKINDYIFNYGGKIIFTADYEEKDCCKASMWFRNHNLNVVICVICGKELSLIEKNGENTING